MITYRYVRNKQEIVDIIEKNKLYISAYSGFGSLINAPDKSKLFVQYKGAWVAYSNNKPVGICCTIFYHDRKYISCYVLQNFRRQKIGTELVNRYCTNLKDTALRNSFPGFYRQTKFKELMG